jgi:hypothetical protein
MPPRKLILGCLGRFALVYGLLIAPWPGFNATYGRYFRALGELTFARENSRELVHFEAVPAEARHVLDTRIVLADRARLDTRGVGPMRYLELDSRGVGWVPTAMTIALVLATPVPWWRRGRALFGSLLAAHGFILFSVAAYIWNASAGISLITFSPFWKQMAEGLEETLITQMGASFVGPVLIWVLVTVRAQDLKAWRSNGEDVTSHSGL